MGTEEDIPFGVWLRREMERRGYETEGPRAGGRTRLANETGISLSVISRILIDNRVPEIKALRAIGEVFGYSLGEMMVAAGLASPEEITTRVIVGPVQAAADIPRPTIEIPPGVDPSSIPHWEWELWNVDLPLRDRQALIHFARLLRGELKSAPEELLELKEAIDNAVSDFLRSRQDPPRAV